MRRENTHSVSFSLFEIPLTLNYLPYFAIRVPKMEADDFSGFGDLACGKELYNEAECTSLIFAVTREGFKPVTIVISQ